MDIRQITPAYAAAPQLDPSELEQVAALGFKTLICNRPDEEIAAPQQMQAMRAAAQAAGLIFVANPVTRPTMDEARIGIQRKAMDAPGPVLAYCASGTRSTMLWSLANAATMPTDEILAAAASGGYDLEAMRPMLDAAKS
ncbi:MAG: TIGR01244 family phosphatase [Rhodobacteraceae bacterium]|nr:TIGR01244 family phosphatase [Paracoccaceae bacterium]